MASVTLITADHNQGKTSRLIQQSKTLDKGTFEGYACVKRFTRHHAFQGYDLVRLSRDEILPALTLKELYHEEFKDFFVFGPFVFSQDAFYTVELTLLQALKDPTIKTLLMDEIGQVELMDMGYAWIFKEALRTDKQCILCVNSRVVKNVIRHFEIKDPILIKVTQETPISS